MEHTCTMYVLHVHVHVYSVCICNRLMCTVSTGLYYLVESLYCIVCVHCYKSLMVVYVHLLRLFLRVETTCTCTCTCTCMIIITRKMLGLSPHKRLFRPCTCTCIWKVVSQKHTYIMKNRHSNN